MIAAFERDQTCARNPGSEDAAFLERDRRIVATMQHDCWNPNLRQQFSDVDVIGGASDARGIVWRRGYPLQDIEPTHLLGRAVRYEPRSEDLTECRVLLAPAVPHQGLYCIGLLDFRGIAAPAGATSVAPLKHGKAY